MVYEANTAKAQQVQEQGTHDIDAGKARLELLFLHHTLEKMARIEFLL
jgi:hypothetical protein